MVKDMTDDVLTHEMIKKMLEVTKEEGYEATMRRCHERELHRIEQLRLKKEQQILKELRARGYMQ